MLSGLTLTTRYLSGKIHRKATGSDARSAARDVAEQNSTLKLAARVAK
jgi:hypothetical protein